MFKRQKTKGIIIPKDSDEVRILMEDRKEYEEDKRRYEEVIYRNNKEGVDMAIKTICSLVRTCHMLVEEYGVKIRWFTYVNEIKNEHIKHNIYAVNCEELDRRIEPYGSEEEVIYQFTQINRESLVFRYNKAEEGSSLPNVLFTADSNFEFCRGEKVPFNQRVGIVTVPHHGSRDKEHKKVYENLEEDMGYVFIRSSERHESRPSEEYKKYPHTKRYCIRCGRKGSDQ